MYIDFNKIEDKKIKVLAYSINDRVLSNIEYVLKGILKSRGCAEIYSAVYTCLKELLINAIKANFKNIYFEGYTHFKEPENPISYQMGLKLFKLEMSRENADYLSRIARTENKNAETMFVLNGCNLQIIITNPVGMTEIEQENVNRKLNDARQCSDITDYFLMVQDDPNQEGAGLGLVLISIMLKNLGVGESSFSIISNGSETKAAFTIPLTEETKARFSANT